MKADKRLETLCEEFGALEEGEKDCLLDYAQALVSSAQQGLCPKEQENSICLSVSGQKDNKKGVL